MRKGEKRPDLYKARVGNCVICNSEYRATNDFKGREQKYCSRACWSNRAPKLIKICLKCNCEILTYDTRQKYCSKVCAGKARIGLSLSQDTKLKMSNASKGRIPVNVFKAGKEHPFWNEDRTDQRERKTPEYKEWRILVLKRDNYQCQICGERPGKGKRIVLDVDHIKGFAQYPEHRVDINNGRTLCRDCHKKTHNWGKRKPKAILEEA